MGSPVVGVNTNGNGVSGSGSQYGVYGASTAAFAGVTGVTETAAPALLGNSRGSGPGILAFSGLGGLVYTVQDNTIDNAAVDLAQQNPDCAAIFVGDVYATGLITAQSLTLSENLQAANLTASGAVSAASAAITGDLTATNVTASGTVSSHDATFTGKITANDATFSGDITANDVKLSGADCAEEFDAAHALEIEPGTVVVFDNDAALSACADAYDTRVAGVISGAGHYRPAVILDRRASRHGRVALALMGKVFCKVDAGYAPIWIGDLLTTSPTPGCAMKASDPHKSFGAVIGKALGSHQQGCGLIPILVGLR
jgi:hypothetical protein